MLTQTYRAASLSLLLLFFTIPLKGDQRELRASIGGDVAHSQHLDVRSKSIQAASAAEDAKLGVRIATAAKEQIGVTKSYDPAYTVLKYPGGDVPLKTGVCTDVVVRALRKIGMDLQKEVHEDMRKNFRKYPQNWSLKRADKNIDHRRVPNLQRYFERHQIALKERLNDFATYRPGDIVAWNLGGGVLHIGVVSDKSKPGIPLIIHNIGSGAEEEDILFKFKIIGHYRVKEKIKAGGKATGRQPASSKK